MAVQHKTSTGMRTRRRFPAPTPALAAPPVSPPLIPPLLGASFLGIDAPPVLGFEAPPVLDDLEPLLPLVPEAEGSVWNQLRVLRRIGALSIFSLTKAGLISASLHAVLLIGLGLAIVVQPFAKHQELFTSYFTFEEPPRNPAAAPDRLDSLQGTPLEGDEVHFGGASPKGMLPAEARMVVEISSIADELAMAVNTPPSPLGTKALKPSDFLREVALVQQDPSEIALARTDEARQAAVKARGGTPETEAAVGKALEWLVHHQNYDGSWSFDHRLGGDCQGHCTHPGVLSEVRVGATAMALLPFLGAGQTHMADKYGKESKYRKNVLAGLRYIMHYARHTSHGSLTQPGGRMYDHGLATLALCEAYGMTQDKDLVRPAQAALAFIVHAQDPHGGGWRYVPGMAGDTSVVAWQLMALKSGHLAYLKVPSLTIARASHFLDLVAQEGGAGYGYTNPEKGTAATSAAGLLCRMYMGWNKDNPALVQGVEHLSDMGPLSFDMYYNYYATQVLHHYEGPHWEKWNVKMRSRLIESQAVEGHETGSWFFEDDRHGSVTGGRLYCTSLAAMTLEVYYRYAPLYSKKVTKDDFGKAASGPLKEEKKPEEKKPDGDAKDGGEKNADMKQPAAE
jgi:hypothetical protein